MERAAAWPEEAQAELVRFMIDTEAKHFGVYHLSDAEREAVRLGLEDIHHGRLQPTRRLQRSSTAIANPHESAIQRDCH